jgi:hypothetical protein
LGAPKGLRRIESATYYSQPYAAHADATVEDRVSFLFLSARAAVLKLNVGRIPDRSTMELSLFLDDPEQV